MKTQQLMNLIDNGSIIIVQMNNGEKRVIERYNVLNVDFFKGTKEIVFTFMNSIESSIEFTHGESFDDETSTYYVFEIPTLNFNVLHYTTNEGFITTF